MLFIVRAALLLLIATVTCSSVLGGEECSKDDSCPLVDHEPQRIPGRALYLGGFSFVPRLPANTVDEHTKRWYGTNEPAIVPVIAGDYRLTKLVDKLTIQSKPYGELWESTESSIFRYWLTERVLEKSAGGVPGEKWINVSHNYEKDAFDSSKCQGLKGRYSIGTPILDKLTMSFLQHLTGTRSPEPTLFGGCNGTATALHFDSAKNFFLQLRGTKRFLLFPPEYILDIYSGVTGHPYYRQSLAEPWDMSELDLEKFPRMRSLVGKAVIADLVPGDLLLIPTWWSHFVLTTSDDSLGMALRWPRMDQIAQILQAQPLPFELDWPQSKTWKMLKYIIVKLIPNSKDIRIYFDRWRVAFPDACKSTGKKDSSSSHNEVTLRDYQSKADALVKKIHDTISDEKFKLEAHVAMMMTMDYADDVLLTILGAEHVHDFVCNWNF